MRNRVFTAVFVACSVLLAACNQQSNVELSDFPLTYDQYYERYDFTSPPLGPNLENMPTDLGDLALVTKAFVWPLIATGGCLTYSWDSPADINADDLIDICAYNNMLNLPTEPADLTIFGGAAYAEGLADAGSVENVLQKYFDVTVEHLRTSKRYDAQTNTYAMLSGWGGGGEFLALSADIQGDLIAIHVGYGHSDRERIDNQGVLSIRLDAEGNIHYQSYKILNIKKTG